MASPRILRVQVLDSPQEYVVLRVESCGPQKLDLQIVGTDEAAAFTGRIDHKTRSKLRSEPIHISDDDWTNALSALFTPDAGTEPVTDTEMLAKVETDAMNLLVRKNVQGITVSEDLISIVPPY